MPVVRPDQNSQSSGFAAGGYLYIDNSSTFTQFGAPPVLIPWGGGTADKNGDLSFFNFTTPTTPTCVVPGAYGLFCEIFGDPQATKRGTLSIVGTQLASNGTQFNFTVDTQFLLDQSVSAPVVFVGAISATLRLAAGESFQIEVSGTYTPPVTNVGATLYLTKVA